MGTWGTRTKLITPMRMKLPLDSWRTSSHSSEHWRSGKIREGVMQIKKTLANALCLNGGTGKAKSQFRRAHGVLHEHGDGHRADAAGIGRDPSSHRADSGKINVADEARAAFGGRIGDAIHADIDHDRAFLDHVCFDKFRRPESGNKNVRPSAVGRHVAGLRVANGDSRSSVPAFLNEDRGHRFADDIATTKNDSVGASDGRAGAQEQLMNTGGRARPKTRIIA